MSIIISCHYVFIDITGKLEATSIFKMKELFEGKRTFEIDTLDTVEQRRRNGRRFKVFNFTWNFAS